MLKVRCADHLDPRAIFEPSCRSPVADRPHSAARPPHPVRRAKSRPSRSVGRSPPAERYGPCGGACSGPAVASARWPAEALRGGRRALLECHVGDVLRALIAQSRWLRPRTATCRPGARLVRPRAVWRRRTYPSIPPTGRTMTPTPKFDPVNCGAYIGWSESGVTIGSLCDARPPRITRSEPSQVVHARVHAPGRGTCRVRRWERNIAGP